MNGRSLASNRGAGITREEHCNSFYQVKGFCLTAYVGLFRIPGLAVGLLWDAECSPHHIPTSASPILLPFGLPTDPQDSRFLSQPETTCSPCDRARVHVPNTGPGFSPETNHLPLGMRSQQALPAGPCTLTEDIS